ncbi:MAG: hypothetical protein AB7O26_06915 [Planctomycetaceae bacterium]
MLLIFAAASCSQSEAAPENKRPATVEDAAQVLDLAKFPLLSGAEKPNQQTLARLSYNVPGKVKEIFEAQRKELLGRKWTEHPGTYVSDESSSATFGRDGYTISLSVFPPGTAGVANVMISNHGNVALDKLPVPEGCQSLYSFPSTAAYVTEKPAKETVEACRKLLIAEGWKPYGEAGDTIVFKQNAIELRAFITTAPAQGNKTSIQYSSSLMSVDLPAPEETERLQYSDSPSQISFDSKMKIEEIAKFYRDTLAKDGWEATTEKPFKIDFRDEMIFRNKPMDMLTLQMNEVDGKTRVLLRHETAARVEEIEKAAKAAIEKRKMEQNKPLPKISLKIPTNAKEIEKSKSRIEFKTATGSGKPAVDGIRKQLTKAGWKEKVNADDPAASAITFSKGDQSIDLLLVDPGFIPAEITVTASGLEFATEPEKKK